MNEIETATITSMEVAEMTGKTHYNLLRSIASYEKHFSQLNFELAEYFNLSTYLDEQEKERKCYNITKKGCEFIAHKMTGIKGTEFTVKYIERFHEMEQAISQQEVLEQKQEKKSLSQWTPEEIVDWKLNDLHKRLQKIERQDEEKPKIGRIQRLVPQKKTWYDRNKSRIWCITRSRNQKLQEQIALKEEYLSKMNSGAEIRQQLKIKKNGLMDELAIVEKQIASADNSAKEERIEELEAEMREIAQSVADEEKMLYLLEKFMKAKMMILSKMVNEKFGIVNWKLFDKQVNGAVVECCECMVNGVPYSALNTGHRIVAGLDIIHALSVMHDVTAPIFVDNAEAVNDYNIPEMEGQLVLLQVTDDKELKVEREDMRND